MSIRRFKLLILLIISNALYAQKIEHTGLFRDIDSERYFRYHYDNDYFAATDENYTQGYNFEFVSPILEKNPLNSLFFKLKGDILKYGLSIEHIGFTPNDYVSEAIQFEDRPFAAAIMLKSFVISTNIEHKTRWSQSLSLGIIGPGAFGKEMQVGIHKATGNKIPGGWDNQIKNDVVLNYRIAYERQILHYKRLFALQVDASAQLGTLFTNASFGFNTQIGIINTAFDNTETKKKFQVYLYGQPNISLVGYDATLQGGFFNTKSPYTITDSNVQRFTAQYNYGVILKTRTLYFEYTRSALTREFNSGASAKWGGIRIGFTF